MATRKQPPFHINIEDPKKHYDLFFEHPMYPMYLGMSLLNNNEAVFVRRGNLSADGTIIPGSLIDDFIIFENPEKTFQYIEQSVNRFIKSQEYILSQSDIPSKIMMTSTARPINSKRSAETQGFKLPAEPLCKKLHHSEPSLPSNEDQAHKEKIGEAETIADEDNLPEVGVQNNDDDDSLSLHLSSLQIEENDNNGRNIQVNTGNCEIPGFKLRKALKPPIWKGSFNPTGFYLREKLGGVVCVWDGKGSFLSRKNIKYPAPEEFIKNFPKKILVGVLHLKEGKVQKIARKIKSDNFEDWEDLQFVLYDILQTKAPFQARIETLEELLAHTNSQYIKLCEYKICQSLEEYRKELFKIREKGSEGLFLNHWNRYMLQGQKACFYLAN